jgi:hypothetical protein
VKIEQRELLLDEIPTEWSKKLEAGEGQMKKN